MYLDTFPHKEKQEWSELFPEAPQEAIDLLGQFLAFNPYHRISINEVFEHPFLKDIRLKSAED